MFFAEWSEQKLLRALQSMLERVFAHDAWSFQQPIVMRRRSAPTYLGIMTTTQEQADWVSEIKVADVAGSNDGGEHASQRLVFGRLVLPWDAQTIFPGVQLCDEDGGHEEPQESAVSKILECPSRSKRYLQMCRKANAHEHEYAEQFNTAALLHYHKVVLCLLGAAEHASARERERFSDLEAGLVAESQLLASLYQPVDIVKSIVGHIDSFHRASVNMMKAYRTPAPEEDEGAPSQENPNPTRVTFVQSNPEKLQSQHKSTISSDGLLQRRVPEPQTLDDPSRPAPGPSQATPKQSMQNSQDPSTHTPEDIPPMPSLLRRTRVPRTGGIAKKVSANSTTSTKQTTQGATSIQEARRRAAEVKLSDNPKQSQPGEKADVEVTDNLSKRKRPAVTSRPTKPRRHATVETDDEETS